MAKKRKTKKQKQKEKQITIELLSVAGIIISVFALTQWGFFGVLMANLYRFLVGNLYMVLAILLIALFIYTLFKKTRPKIGGKNILASILLGAGLLILTHANFFGKMGQADINIIETTFHFWRFDLTHSRVANPLGGGMIGAVLYAISYFMFDQIGTYVLAGLALVASAFLYLNLSFSEFLKQIQLMISKAFGFTRNKASALYQRWAQKRSEKAHPEEIPQTSPPHEDLAVNEDSKEELEESSFEIEMMDQAKKETPEPVKAEPDLREDPGHDSQKDEVSEADDLDQMSMVGEQENEDYQLPPIDLLDDVEASDQSGEYQRIQKNVKELEKTFESFGVDAKVVKANLGPAVTKYEVQPATGVKVSKIVNLADDIALALAAKDVRIEAPIPGKALIGIEVPNQDVSFVSFKEVMDDGALDRKNLLEVPLGKDVSGNTVMMDISKMPHALVAGATGSGKSVAINGIITALLMKARPNEVKLMMIDPKMVELSNYNGIPHLLTPVVTNPKKAAQALNKVVQEMERRYELFAASQTRNRETYNNFIRQQNEETGDNKPLLPYVVVIVDELADLMMVAGKEVETAITRLAQMARAAGIHMILATQRPSVDVITGIIKANVPSRIAFSVSSGTDSRTILDQNGAEKLLGKGDMLYLPMGQNKATRIQGSFISDQEVEKVIDFVKDQQEVNYVEEMMVTEEDNLSTEEPEDELYEEAVALVADMETASISMLQRKFRIGYNRAARLIDDMEARGVVGPADGSKPRDVLIEAEPQIEDDQAEE